MKHGKYYYVALLILIILVALGTVIPAIDVNLIHRLKDPSLTETQLILYGLHKYWWLYIFDISGYLIIFFNTK